MKNKLLVALIAITVMLCGAFAFTACGGNEQSTETNGGLTAEELRQAIEATLNAQNAKIHETRCDPRETSQSATIHYDYEKGIAKYESLDGSGYIVMGKDSLWNYKIQNKECDKMWTASIKEGVMFGTFICSCLYKPNGDDSAHFVPIEETYASFKYNSVTNTYAATLLGMDNISGTASVFEIKVSLTVENGYVTKFEFKWEIDSKEIVETYIFSDFGTVEITVPDEVMKLVQEREQNN